MNTAKDVHEQVAAYIRSHPDDSFQTIAGRLGLAYSTVSRIAKTHGLSRGKRLENINLAELQEGNNG